MTVTSGAHPLSLMATPVDKKLVLPAWAQVERDLRSLIEQEQVLEAGLQLPTEKDIAVIYDVSRITIRQALATLAEEGYVERRQGAGTFVADRPHHVQHDFGLTTPWRDRFRRAGEDAQSIHLAEAAEEEEPYELARRIAPEERALPRLHLKRLHLVNSKPIGITDSWLAGRAADALRGDTLIDGSVSKSLDPHGIFESDIDHILEVRSVTSLESVLLEASIDAPVFIDWSIGRAGDDLVQTSRTVWLGARVRFHYSSDMSTASAMEQE